MISDWSSSYLTVPLVGGDLHILCEGHADVGHSHHPFWIKLGPPNQNRSLDRTEVRTTPQVKGDWSFSSSRNSYSSTYILVHPAGTEAAAAAAVAGKAAARRGAGAAAVARAGTGGAEAAVTAPLTFWSSQLEEEQSGASLGMSLSRKRW